MTQKIDIASAVQAIREYLVTSSPHYAGAKVDASTPLLQGGALDSLGILNLMVFLSQSMNIEVVDEDFVPENFATVGDLAAFVVRKR